MPTINPKIGSESDGDTGGIFLVVFWILVVAFTHPLTPVVHRSLGLDLESSQEWGNALAGSGRLDRKCLFTLEKLMMG